MADPIGTRAAPDTAQPLVLRPHPFSNDHGIVPVKAGQTLQQMLDEAAQGAELAATLRVEVGGYEVPRELWGRVRPKAGTAIHATVMPAGSGGEGGGKKWLRTLLMIVVMVVAWYAAPYLGAAMGISTQMAAAAIYMVGSLIVNALVPPPQPKLGGPGNAGEGGQLNMLTGSSNQLSPYGPIPLVIGECRIFPPHAAMPYSLSLGQSSFQILTFDLGYGDLTVSDIRIGDTPIEQFEDVQYEITKTPTLYTSDVFEASISAAMNDGDSVTRLSAPNVDEISLDVVFPQGLFGMDKKGNLTRATAYVTIEYRRVGTTAWQPVPNNGYTPPGMSTGPLARASGVGASTTFTAAWGAYVARSVAGTGDRKPFAVGYSWPVPKGQYEVRVSRSGTNWGSAEPNSRIGDAVWSVMRSIRHTTPSKTNTTKLCMRIKASEQLNGTLQTLSCTVRQKVPVYDRATATWSAPQFTLNPAWIYHWLLTACPAFAVHVPAARVDLENIADYAEFCTLHDFETRGVLDTRVTARALLDDVLACSLGAVTLRDGKYGVLFDDGTTVPSMVFTPLDSRNFTASRVFTRIPHALKVRFKNPAANWQMDEIVVVDDGYAFRGMDARGNPLEEYQRETLTDIRFTEDNKIRAIEGEPLTPTEFETIELRMAADAHQAWRIARHHFAQAKFRPNVFSLETDIANLACTRGDLVHVAHDVTEWGDGWGQVISIDDSTLTLDETVELDAGASYSVRLRRQDGSSEVIAAINTVGGATNVFELASAPTGVNPGDIAVIGETTRETKALLITGVHPAADLGARITAVEYDARVAPYWADPPDSIISEVTGVTYTDPPRPPSITVIVSHPINDTRGDDGATAPEVHIGIGDTSGYVRPTRPLHVRDQVR